MVAYEADIGVVGAVMAGPGGSVVNPQEGQTGKGICGSGASRFGTRRGDGTEEGSSENNSARTWSVVDAAGVWRKGEEWGSSVEVTGT